MKEDASSFEKSTGFNAMTYGQESDHCEPRPEARLGAALRQAREAQGISLRALARKLYRSHSTLVEYERGHRLAPLEVVEAYESELGAPSGTLAALHDLACLQLYGEDRSHRKTYVLRSLPLPGTEGGTSPISFRRRLKSFSVQ